MKKFRFLDWQVYKEAKKLFSFLLEIVRKLPKEYRYDIGSQILRSGLSIILNIAEGSGKTSDKELNRYFNIALGSLFETLAAVDVLKDNNLLDKKEFNKILEFTTSISNQLGGFKKQLSHLK